MGAILVLTPLVISSWPAISAAAMGAAAAMGFSVVGGATAEQAQQKRAAKRKVESELPNSEIFAETMTRGQKIVIQRDDVTIEIGQDERGACTVSACSDKRTDSELRQIGEEVGGRIVQQFAYHKLMTELKRRNASIVEESVMQDQSIQVRVRL